MKIAGLDIRGCATGAEDIARTGGLPIRNGLSSLSASPGLGWDLDWGLIENATNLVL